MDLINSFPTSDLVTIIICILVLAAVFLYNRLQNSFHQKIKNGSPDIITYDVTPEISIVGGPVVMEGKHLVAPYYIWELKFEDQWGNMRSKQFKLLEQYLGQDIIDQFEKNKKDGNWVDDIGLESSELQSKRFKLIADWIMNNINHQVQVKQDSARKWMFQLENPLRGQQTGDHNNAQEMRHKSFIKLPTSVVGIIIIIAFPIILLLAVEYGYLETIISYLHLG